MKKIFRKAILLGIIACMGTSALAQEINSTYMLEMAPYRHYINPAFEPITNGYFYLPAVSRLSLSAGNNSLAMKDLIFNQDGRTMWALNPASEKDLMSAFRKNTLIRANASTALLGFGFRKGEGYVHVNLDVNVDAGITLPRDLFGFALGGGMQDLTGVNTYDLSSLGMQAQAYLSLAIGYSRKFGDQWAFGMKVKLLDGFAYAGISNKSLQLNASPEQWTLQGSGTMAIAAPINEFLQEKYPASPEVQDMKAWFEQTQTDPLINLSDIKNVLTPCGYGAAVDLGVTYQPISQVKLSLSLTDLGGIYWTRGRKMGYDVSGTFEGVGTINYADYTDADGQFDSKRLGDTLSARLTDVYANAIHKNDLNRVDGQYKDGFGSMLTMKLNAGVDAYFLNNLLGLGVYSRTMLYQSKLYEELTLGASVRPTTWFNFGVSYSMLNGRWDNIGAAIGLRGGPLALTLAADYVPMTYAKGTADNGRGYAIPYKAQGLNFEMGLAVVWGWRDKQASRKSRKAAEQAALAPAAAANANAAAAAE